MTKEQEQQGSAESTEQGSGASGEETPQEDVFGISNENPSGSQQNSEEEQEGKEEEDEDPKEALAREREEKARLEEKDKAKDENIRNMRRTIKEYEKSQKKQGGQQNQQGQQGQQGNEQGGQGDGSGEGGDALFSDIKSSKDLSKEEKEEMTEGEIRQMDENAELKNGMNRLYNIVASQQQQIQNQGKNEETDEEGGDEENEEEGSGAANVTETIKSRAQELSGGDNEMAKQIIESAKKFKLDGLDEETLKERVDEAAKLVPNYQPPKEQSGKKGKAVKGGGSNNDPHGVDQIVQEATQQGEGTYSL